MDKVGADLTQVKAKIVPIAQKVLPKKFKPLRGRNSECIEDEWRDVLAFAPQIALEKERIDVANAEVIAYTFDALVGEYAKVYLFLRDNGKCVDGAFGVGSYRAANANASVPVYHLDLYGSGSQSTLDLGKTKPDYDSARQIALRYLNSV